VPKLPDTFRREATPPARAEAAPEAVPAAPRWPHNPADHLSWAEPDGSVTRVCLCTCDRCWVAGPCPDWNADTEDV
jgi:hypothetical protein